MTLFPFQTLLSGLQTMCGNGWTGPLKSMLFRRSTQPCSTTQMEKNFARWAKRTSWDLPASITRRSCSHISVTSGKVSPPPLCIHLRLANLGLSLLLPFSSCFCAFKCVTYSFSMPRFMMSEYIVTLIFHIFVTLSENK